MTGIEEIEELEEDVEVEAVDPTLSSGGAFCVVGCRNRGGEASRSALSRSRSTMSMIDRYRYWSQWERMEEIGGNSTKVGGMDEL